MHPSLLQFSRTAAIALLALSSAAFAAKASPKPFEVTDSTFKCITTMTPVRHFYVDNLAGNLDKTVAAANAKKGAKYPPGSVVQLVPTEVMVKQAPGSNPVTKDWEFFELDTTPEGSKIIKRGFADVVNRFGGNCFACHTQAKAQWDLICETGHGCAPISLTHAMTTALQRSDPRCVPPNPLTDADKTALGELDALMKSMTKK